MKIPSEGGWTFENQEIAGAFDDHVRDQLPWYDLATGMVAHIIRHYLPKNGVIYDIGSATGNITRSVGLTLKERNATAISIEPSQEMSSQFKGYGHVEQSTAQDYKYEKFDIAVLFLTMMFVPIKDRATLIERLNEQCNVGGCIIIFDKCRPESGYIATVLSRLTLAGKVATGTPPDEIVKKELSLSGCQRPYICNIPGAIQVFRFGDFVGWVVEKGEEMKNG